MAHSENHAHFKRQGHSDHAAKLRAFGGKADEKADKKMIVKAIRQHENAEHGGKHEKLTLKTGGKAKHHAHRPSRKAKADGGRITQPDQDARNKRENYGSNNLKREVHADGGRLGAPKRKSSGSKGHGSHVNVIVAPGQSAPHPVPVPVPMRPPGAAGPPPPPAGAMPPRPMMPPGAGPVGMPPGGGGGPPIMPPGMAGARPMQAAGGRVGRAKGGRVHFDAGAGSGEGRLEKEKAAHVPPNSENKPVSEHDENKGDTTSPENKKLRTGGRV